jgi:hypothetical protein
MDLTSAEAATLKTNVQANFAELVAVSDWPAVANAYNLPSNPAVNLWRNDVSPTEIAATITMSAFTALTQQQQNGLLLLTQGQVDATSSNVRAAFSTIFGAGATLTALTALAQRVGTRAEVLFSSAAGAANVSTKFGQRLTADDVQRAMQ